MQIASHASARDGVQDVPRGGEAVAPARIVQARRAFPLEHRQVQAFRHANRLPSVSTPYHVKERRAGTRNISVPTTRNVSGTRGDVPTMRNGFVVPRVRAFASPHASRAPARSRPEAFASPPTSRAVVGVAHGRGGGCESGVHDGRDRRLASRLTRERPVSHLAAPVTPFVIEVAPPRREAQAPVGGVIMKSTHLRAVFGRSGGVHATFGILQRVPREQSRTGRGGRDDVRRAKRRPRARVPNLVLARATPKRATHSRCRRRTV